MNNPIPALQSFFIDLNNEDYSEALECVMVAYELRQEILNGNLPKDYYGRSKVDHVISLVQAWMNDNTLNPDRVTNPNESFADCADKILSVGLNY